MDCNKADEAIMLYMEKRLKPFKKAMLVKHLLICRPCRESFTVMDGLMENEMESLCEAPSGFTEGVMAAVRKMPVHEPKPADTNVSDMIMRMLWGILTMVMGVGFVFVYNGEVINRYLGSYSWFQTLTRTLDEIGDLINRNLISLIQNGEQIGLQTTALLANVSTQALIIVGLSSSLLIVSLRNENIKA